MERFEVGQKVKVVNPAADSRTIREVQDVETTITGLDEDGDYILDLFPESWHGSPYWATASELEAVKTQTLEELQAENESLDGQIQRLSARIERKRGFHKQNAEEIARLQKEKEREQFAPGRRVQFGRATGVVVPKDWAERGCGLSDKYVLVHFDMAAGGEYKQRRHTYYPYFAVQPSQLKPLEPLA